MNDKYGNNVPGPYIMGTLEVSDLDEVRRYHDESAFAVRAKINMVSPIQLSRASLAERRAATFCASCVLFLFQAIAKLVIRNVRALEVLEDFSA